MQASQRKTQNGAAENQRTLAQPLQYSPPAVSFRNGYLSLLARNNTLADVLSAIARATGASLQLPAAASNERVAASLGPAPVAQVIAALLNGSNFDYVLMNRADNPAALQSMILTVKSGPAPTGPQPGEQQVANAPEEDEEPQGPAAELPQESQQPSPQQPTQNSEQNPSAPEQPPVQMEQQPNGQRFPVQPQGQPVQTTKTPEQLLEELKQMQQQQQRQQQQPAQPPPN